MSRFTADTQVRFLPFTRQIEGEDAVIGRPEARVFLALPVEALELLDELQAGKSIGEVQEEHRRKTGELPDLESLLSYLEERGFLAPDGPLAAGSVSRPETPIRYHFAGFPQGLAQKLFGRAALTAYGLLILLAMAAAFGDPRLRPSWKHLFFDQHVTLMASLLMVSGLLLTFLHEMGHLVAARARGVSCTLGISNRFWVLVAETDMTGVWALPRSQRYLPILAGPLVDAVCGAFLTLVLFGHYHGLIGLPPLLTRFVQALATVYILKMVWQLYFFVRTDFYYVYTMTFGCRNLMKDTQDFLRNRFFRLIRRTPPVDQSHIPAREMKAIRFYSGFWLVGRLLAFTVFFGFIMPALLGYLGAVFVTLVSPRSATAYQVLDAGAFGIASMGLLLLGIGFWIKGIFKNWRWQRAMAVDDSVAKR